MDRAVVLPWPEARSVLRLAVPIALTQIGMVLYGTVDMAFVGRLGPSAIASVGLGAMTYFTGFVVGMGVVMGIDSHSSKAFGAGRPDECGQLLVHTLALSLAVATPLFFAYALAGPVFQAIGVDPSVVAGATGYLKILRWAVFPGLCFVACRQFLQSMSVISPLLAAIVAGNLANAFLDAALVFGRFGAPSLGVRGSAYATLAANGVMLAIAAAAAWGRLARIGFRFRGWRRRLFVDVFSVGLPGGLQMLVEVAIFSLVTALVGRFGAVTLAAHQLTLNLASMTFMVPMGLSHAAAARVGQALGRGDARGAAASGRAATLMAVAFMAVMGVSFACAPSFFLGLYGAGAPVILIAAPLLQRGVPDLRRRASRADRLPAGHGRDAPSPADQPARPLDDRPPGRGLPRLPPRLERDGPVARSRGGARRRGAPAAARVGTQDQSTFLKRRCAQSHCAGSARIHLSTVSDRR